jgi:RDD family
MSALAEREQTAPLANELPSQNSLLVPEDAGSWRKEVSERLNRYHARRRPRPPRYPSLRLKFDTPESRWAAVPRDPNPPAPSGQAIAQSAPIMHQAVAVNYVEPAAESSVAPESRPEELVPPPPRHNKSEHTAKLIEFPRTIYTPQAWASDLAEPILDRPRILEAPEIVPPPPALGGMTIEEAEKPEPERRPGIDMPLQSASIGQRFLAGLVDGALVVAAGGIFVAVAYRIAGFVPERTEIAGLGAGLLMVCWAAYHYLLVVYSGSTPGLRALRLQVRRFDGSVANQKERRARVLCSLLSAVSLGLGYAWHFLDEDGLCWHERVTRTHIALNPKSE